VGELLEPRPAGTSPGSSPPRRYGKATSLAPREQLLQDVAHLAKALCADSKYSLEEHLRSYDGHPDDASNAAAFFGEDLRDAFQKIATFIGGPSEYFHLAIDECSAMGNRLHILRRLWSHTTGVVLFLLDTNTQLALSYDTSRLPSSARVESGNKQLKEPFIALPRNLALDRDVTRYVEILRGDGNPVTHQELLTWLSKMGRPLLDDTPYQAIHEDTTITKLQIKLLGRRSNSLGQNMEKKPWGDCQETMALLAQRMPLTLIGLRGTCYTGDAEIPTEDPN